MYTRKGQGVFGTRLVTVAINPLPKNICLTKLKQMMKVLGTECVLENQENLKKKKRHSII